MTPPDPLPRAFSRLTQNTVKVKKGRQTLKKGVTNLPGSLLPAFLHIHHGCSHCRVNLRGSWRIPGREAHSLFSEPSSVTPGSLFFLRLGQGWLGPGPLLRGRASGRPGSRLAANAAFGEMRVLETQILYRECWAQEEFKGPLQ